MEGVAAHAETGDFGVNGRTAGLGMFVLFQHHHASTVAEHETITLLVPGAAGRCRVVVTGGQGTRGGKATQAGGAGGHLGTTGNHHVGVAVFDQARCIADGMGCGGAGGGDGVVGALHAIQDGQVAGDHVDDVAGYEERRDLARTAFEEGRIALLNAAQATDAGTDGDADALGVFVGNFQSGIPDGLDARSHAIVDEGRHLAGVLGLHVVRDVKVLHRATEAHGKIADIKMGDGRDATLACQDIGPGIRHVSAHGGNHAQTGNNDTSFRHGDNLTSNSAQ